MGKHWYLIAASICSLLGLLQLFLLLMLQRILAILMDMNVIGESYMSDGRMTVDHLSIFSAGTLLIPLIFFSIAVWMWVKWREIDVSKD